MTTIDTTPLKRWLRYYDRAIRGLAFVLPCLLCQNTLPSTDVTPLLPLTATAVLSLYTSRYSGYMSGMLIGLVWGLYADVGWWRVLILCAVGFAVPRRWWHTVLLTVTGTVLLVGISWQIITTVLCLLPVGVYGRCLLKGRNYDTSFTRNNSTIHRGHSGVRGTTYGIATHQRRTLRRHR